MTMTDNQTTTNRRRLKVTFAAICGFSILATDASNFHVFAFPCEKQLHSMYHRRPSNWRTATRTNLVQPTPSPNKRNKQAFIAISLNKLLQRTKRKISKSSLMGAAFASSEQIQSDQLNESTVSGRRDSTRIINLANSNDHRYSASDWLQNMSSLPRSSILRAIRAPVLTIFAWSTIVSMVHFALNRTSGGARWAETLSIPTTTPHSFLMSALGLLLVFRTNSAYQRFSEGRRIWEKILSTSRNMTRLASLYETDIGRDRRLRMFRLLGAFPYLLHGHITGMDSDAIINGNEIQMPYALLPPKAWCKCSGSSNPPLWITDRLAKEITNVEYSPNYTSRERLTFLSQINTLSKCVGECERIHQTAVPQNYARHSLRSLTIWLWTLPFSLVKDLGLWTGPVMAITSWLLFGVYQIGASIEDPFQGSLRLRALCDAIYHDCMYKAVHVTPIEPGRSSSDVDIALKNQATSTQTFSFSANHRESAYQLDDEEVSEWKEL